MPDVAMIARPCNNRLLDVLPAEAWPLLTSALESVHVPTGAVLYDADRPIHHIYFPQTAVVSLVSTMQDGASAEVALVGDDGLVGLPSLLGGGESSLKALVLIGGASLRATVAAVKAARDSSAPFSALLNRYTRAHLMHTAQSAACSRLHHVEPRLARWLLSIRDRVTTDAFDVTQDVASQMLGIRRPTVTTAMLGFRRDRLITYRGRLVTILNRAALEAVACECYAVLRREGTVLSVIDGEPQTIDVSSPHRGVDRRRVTAGPDVATETLREIAGRLMIAGIAEQEAKEAAEAANRAKDAAIAAMSHELRTPLTAILGWSAMLLAQRESDPSRGLAIIQQNARAQLRLLDDLADASRIAVGTLAIERHTVPIREVIESAIDAIRPAAGDKGVALDLAFGATEATVWGDAARLQQAMLNLLINAIKFTSQGGHVRVALETDEATVRLTVHDTGVGIAPSLLPYVFERFRQGEDGLSRGGLGLGLAIARQVVELHDGMLHVDSAGVGRGTTCTLTLPLRPATYEAPSSPRLVREGGGAIAEK